MQMKWCFVKKINRWGFEQEKLKMHKNVVQNTQVNGLNQQIL